MPMGQQMSTYRRFFSVRVFDLCDNSEGSNTLHNSCMTFFYIDLQMKSHTELIQFHLLHIWSNGMRYVCAMIYCRFFSEIRCHVTVSFFPFAFDFVSLKFVP